MSCNCNKNIRQKLNDIKAKDEIKRTIKVMSNKNIKVLHVFDHGLGDTIQFTSIISHLKHYYPNWTNEVAVGVGRQSIFEKSYFLNNYDRKNYDIVFDHKWNECNKTYENSPSTKACYCLKELFQIEPIWDLLKYNINISDKLRHQAKKYLATLPECKGYVAIHYQGNTASDRKNIDNSIIHDFCNGLYYTDYIPIILDWDNRSTLPFGNTFFNPEKGNSLWGGIGTGDAEALAALISECVMFVGIDSGPQKVAFATNTPSIAIWTHHHPINYCDNVPNVIHLVAVNPKNDLPFFNNNYKYVVYNNLLECMREEVCNVLNLSGVFYHKIF